MERSECTYGHGGLNPSAEYSLMPGLRVLEPLVTRFVRGMATSTDAPPPPPVRGAGWVVLSMLEADIAYHESRRMVAATAMHVV